MASADNFWSRFQHWYRMQPVGLRTLVAINVVIYVLWLLVLRHIGPAAQLVAEHLALSPRLPDVLFEPWQVVTYNFLHLGDGFWGFVHILFNMLWLHWIGREYEMMHGPARITALYLIAGVGGGLLTIAFYTLFPQLGPVLVYGASASVLGVMAAVATLYPHQSIGLLFIGVVPLKYVVIGFLALDLLFGFSQGVAVTAHIGGALSGFLFARAEQRGLDLSSWATVFFRRRSRSAPRKSASSSSSSSKPRPEGWRQASKQAPATPVRFPPRSNPDAGVLVDVEQREVDRILDKISAKGFESLTEEEKRLLEEASRR